MNLHPLVFMRKIIYTRMQRSKVQILDAQLASHKRLYTFKTQAIHIAIIILKEGKSLVEFEKNQPWSKLSWQLREWRES